jgi:hypothetical protein
MSKYKGNMVSAVQTVLSGTNYIGKANGRFVISEQIQATKSSLWAKGISVPAAPTITSVNPGNLSVSVLFTAPSNLNGETITSYTVTSSGGQTATGLSSPLTVTGLINGTAYTFTVKANSASGSSLASNSISGTPSANSVPSAPTITNVVQNDPSSVNITFTAPSYNGNNVIQYYTVTSSGGQTATISQETGGTATVTSLSALTAYTFTITATNAIGTSASSLQSSSITLPLTVGSIYGGGYYAGNISVAGTGVASHRLIVSPRAAGSSSLAWATVSATTNKTSYIDGPVNSAGLASLGAAYAAATFCEALTIGGYNDWYMPAFNEVEVLYFYFKPSTTANNTGSGANVNAVSPEPINTNYTASIPAQTTVTAFVENTGQESFAGLHWTSSELGLTDALHKSFSNGGWTNSSKSALRVVRAVRRIAI